MRIERGFGLGMEKTCVNAGIGEECAWRRKFSCDAREPWRVQERLGIEGVCGKLELVGRMKVM